MRLYFYLHDSKSPIFTRLWIESIIDRLLFLTPNPCQAFHASHTLQRRVPNQLEIVSAIIGKAFVVRNAHFVCDIDVPVCDDGRPEDGHRGAHYSEIDLEAGNYKNLGVPPRKIKTLGHALTVLEGAPKTEDCHEYNAKHVSNGQAIRQS